MAGKVLVLVGTSKGVFILEGRADRRDWQQRGPYCEAWPINHVIADPEHGTLFAGGGNEWIGHDVWRSDDLGASWTRSGEGLAYAEGEPVLQAVWSLAGADGTLYAGVKPAGLFRSSDGGRSFAEVKGLRAHPTRPQWQGGGAGLILHSLLVDPADPHRLWVGISAAGVFHSADGGATWEPRNRGTRVDFFGEGATYPEFGQCVHCLVMAPGQGDLLYQQSHCGMYRSRDGGRHWDSIEDGLPSSFGFAAATHPRDPDTLYLMPLSQQMVPPGGYAAVWRTRDGGRTWQELRRGLPQENVYFAVLRQALATDRCTPAGVYFGTNSGSLYASADEGESWTCIAQHLPRIHSVETVTLGA
jgi:photosystem II stability/assembly factor-like uncharacterized protein